ncbi:MAG TPA: hypothetical protein VEQ58_02150 [Polyangiaceae bacterium]|nr:hypothetical protein [Polyangiaceae bacterium]
MNPLRLVVSSSLTLSLGLSLAPSAHAEASTQEKALASRLFDEGSKLMASGQASAACGKYAESKRLDPQLGTLLYLGECYAKVGKTASAWVSFKEADDIAAQRRDPRAAKIRERLANVEKTLSNLVIVVADDEPADLEVRQDGALVGRAAWGTPLPIDPGEHEITATSASTKPRTVQALVEKEPRTVTVTLPPLEYLPKPPVAPEAKPEPVVAAASTPRADHRSWLTQHQKTLALVAGGVGVVGVGVGTAFGLMAKSTYDDSAADCDHDVCGRVGHEHRQSAFTQANVATAAFGVGAAALIGGTVLWLTAPRAEPQRKATLVLPVVGPSLALLSVQRSF